MHFHKQNLKIRTGNLIKLQLKDLHDLTVRLLLSKLVCMFMACFAAVNLRQELFKSASSSVCWLTNHLLYELVLNIEVFADVTPAKSKKFSEYFIVNYTVASSYRILQLLLTCISYTQTELRIQLRAVQLQQYNLGNVRCPQWCYESGG